MTIETTWAKFKAFVQARSLSIQYLDVNENYYLYAFDGPFSLSCLIPKLEDPSEEQTDFEDNFKSAGNKALITNTLVQAQPPFGNKTIVVNGLTKRLFARFTGIQAELTEGSNVIEHTATFPWVKMVGIEVVGCEALDTASLKVYDTAGGAYSGTPNALLNQFSYTLNLPDGFYSRQAQFDADLYQGMVLKVEYESVSAKSVGINILMNEVKT